MLKDFRAEKFDVVIQAGQSNSQGCGLGDVAEPYLPNADVWYMLSDFTMTLATETAEGNYVVGNFSLPFADEYIGGGNLKRGRKLLILRSAVGGTGFTDGRWGLKDDLYLTMLEMIKTALGLNAENKLIALLWHQGETDAGNGAPYGLHYKNLNTLLDTVRKNFGCPSLPFVAGDFVHHWKNENIALCEPVVKAIKDVCRDAGSAEFIETDGLKSNFQQLGFGGDNIHFSRQAIYELGKKYYAAYKKIVTK